RRPRQADRRRLRLLGGAGEGVARRHRNGRGAAAHGRSGREHRRQVAAARGRRRRALARKPDDRDRSPHGGQHRQGRSGASRRRRRGACGARARCARRADRTGDEARADADAAANERQEGSDEEDRREEEGDEEQAMKMNITATATMQIATAKLASVVFAPQDDDAEFGVRVTPPELRGWLARLRLLQAVPFSYLVADAQLLPKESIRFFYLDRAWTDALVQGALSVGTVNSSDRAELAALYKVVRDELDEEERRVRLPGGETVQQGPAGPVTGFVLRSRAVSGWPGLHVRAYDRELGVADDAAIP